MDQNVIKSVPTIPLKLIWNCQTVHELLVGFSLQPIHGSVNLPNPRKKQSNGSSVVKMISRFVPIYDTKQYWLNVNLTLTHKIKWHLNININPNIQLTIFELIGCNIVVIMLRPQNINLRESTKAEGIPLETGKCVFHRSLVCVIWPGKSIWYISWVIPYTFHHISELKQNTDVLYTEKASGFAKIVYGIKHDCVYCWCQTPEGVVSPRRAITRAEPSFDPDNNMMPSFFHSNQYSAH